jgi:hypothetical protein
LQLTILALDQNTFKRIRDAHYKKSQVTFYPSLATSGYSISWDRSLNFLASFRIFYRKPSFVSQFQSLPNVTSYSKIVYYSISKY